MVSSSEKRQLLESYREPVSARATIAKSIAGLLIVVLVALFGASYVGEGTTSVTAATPQAASGR